MLFLANTIPQYTINTPPLATCAQYKKNMPVMVPNQECWLTSSPVLVPDAFMAIAIQSRPETPSGFRQQAHHAVVERAQKQ